MTRQSDVDSLLKALTGVEILPISLRSSWSVLEKRTIDRGDRTIAEARRSFDSALNFSADDLEFDTSKLNTEEIAQSICLSISIKIA